MNITNSLSNDPRNVMINPNKVRAIERIWKSNKDSDFAKDRANRNSLKKGNNLFHTFVTMHQSKETKRFPENFLLICFGSLNSKAKYRFDEHFIQRDLS